MQGRGGHPVEVLAEVVQVLADPEDVRVVMRARGVCRDGAVPGA
jgi:hypothetical protein